MQNVLELFAEDTAAWFRSALGEPTPVQKQAWPMIAGGGHVLVSAPTGTGKTLSAFLVFLDRMKRQAQQGELPGHLLLVYISPLKSLAADIRENLRRPLEGIGAADAVSVGIRTGDTPQGERRNMVRTPPHILIITPESLYLMLTSKTGQKVLATAQAVIIDELHALIDTKRGAHLMLSLARLDHLCDRPLQRIGLSATIEPLQAAAEYLAPERVEIAAPATRKEIRLEILSPFADATKGRKKDPVWEELGALVYRYCQGSRSVIAFVEGRRYAEKLAYYVNLLGGEGYARVHHGSLSKEQRMETERSLRDGRLRLLCATSSMELGIDVGEIDQVLQVGCPRTVSGTMQRLGRAGHNPGRVSVMYLFPRTAPECVTCAMTAQLVQAGGIEQASPPSECLDVLAQHLVSMAAYRSYEISEVMEILPRAWPFRNVQKEDVKAVLGMLAGDYEHELDIPARPRILYDRIHEKVEGDGYSRMLAVSAGGTIPDKGLYAVKTEQGVKLGEIDEEFVYESQKGDRFILGSFAWKIVQITRDTVIVAQTYMEGARLPFWKGEIKGRDKRTGEAFGRMYRQLQEAYEEGMLEQTLGSFGMDDAAVKLSAGFLERQIRAAGGLADDRTILVEHFTDASGNSQLMVHSVFGRRINAPLSLLAADAVSARLHMEVGNVDDEEGFLLYAYAGQPLPEGALQMINADTCLWRLEALLPSTMVFHIAFRYNSGRALMMGAKKNGRMPLWMQRLKSTQMLEHVVGRAEHPLIRETRRECLQEVWDAKGVWELLNDIRTGRVRVREIYTQLPSPMSLPLQWGQEAAVMYDYAPMTRKMHVAVDDALRQEKLLLQPGQLELRQVQERGKLPGDTNQLHALLMTEGDLAAGELDIPAEWLEQLAVAGRVVYLEQGLWIAAEHQEEYVLAIPLPEGCGGYGCAPFIEKEGAIPQQEWDSRPGQAQLHIVRRMLRYRGAADVAQTAQRYGWQAAQAQEILEELCRRQEAVMQDGRYYHGELYRRARRHTLMHRRNEVQTCPGQAYAALLLSRIKSAAPGEECLREAMGQYAGVSLPADYWESILLARRVKKYRETMLDSFLAEGELFWKMEEKGRVCFWPQAEIDWDAEPEDPKDALPPKERAVYDALKKRGASFMQALNGVLSGESPYDALLALMEKGLVYADSFLPVRHWLVKEKTRKAAARQRVNMRVKALRAGRWDIVRPLKEPSVEDMLERCFDRSLILSRETAAAWGLSWQAALSVLRIREYTGQVRRGYFVEGMSGAQFIRAGDYDSVIRMLRQPQQDLVWINAVDPAQCWGKVLPHMEGRSFMQVVGNCVACAAGLPIAVMERQGKTLRIFEDRLAGPCMEAFAAEYKKGKLYPSLRRIVVKEYPKGAQQALAQAGFSREMNDYVLYR